MTTHARPRSAWSHRSVVGLGVVALMATGTSIGYAAQSGSSTAIHACYKTNGGALSYRTGSTCPTGSKPLTWNAQGPAGPAGVINAYVGQARYYPTGKKLPDSTSATLLAQTPKLPAGNYVVNATADVLLQGDTEAFCFVAVVGIHPKHDGEDGETWDSDGPDFLQDSVTVDDKFANVPAGSRLGFYCHNGGFDVDSTDHTIIFSIDVNAIRVHSLTTAKVT